MLPSTLLLPFYVALPHFAPAKASRYFCNKKVYGAPTRHDCLLALAALPATDRHPRYFIEQQLATGPPEADWQNWMGQATGVAVQVPKFWSTSMETQIEHTDISTAALTMVARIVQYCFDQLC